MNFVIASGLAGIQSTVITDYLGPAFLLAVAVFAIIEARNRQWMKLFGLVAVAAVVGLLVYGGNGLFGNSGSITKVAGAASNSISSGGGGFSGS